MNLINLSLSYIFRRPLGSLGVETVKGQRLELIFEGNRTIGSQPGMIAVRHSKFQR